MSLLQITYPLLLSSVVYGLPIPKHYNSSIISFQGNAKSHACAYCPGKYYSDPAYFQSDCSDAFEPLAEEQTIKKNGETYVRACMGFVEEELFKNDVDCSYPLNVTNGQVHLFNHYISVTGYYIDVYRPVVGSLLKVECDLGYVARNDQLECIVSNKSATWDVEAACDRTGCLALPPISNGSSSCSYIIHVNGTKCNVMCHSGFSPSVSEVVCVNGTWSSYPKCIEVKSNPGELSLTEITVIVVVVVVVIILIAILILLFCICCKERREQCLKAMKNHTENYKKVYTGIPDAEGVQLDLGGSGENDPILDNSDNSSYPVEPIILPNPDVEPFVNPDVEHVDPNPDVEPFVNPNPDVEPFVNPDPDVEHFVNPDVKPFVNPKIPVENAETVYEEIEDKSKEKKSPVEDDERLHEGFDTLSNDGQDLRDIIIGGIKGEETNPKEIAPTSETSAKQIIGEEQFSTDKVKGQNVSKPQQKQKTAMSEIPQSSLGPFKTLSSNFNLGFDTSSGYTTDRERIHRQNAEEPGSSDQAYISDRTLPSNPSDIIKPEEREGNTGAPERPNAETTKSSDQASEINKPEERRDDTGRGTLEDNLEIID